MTPTYTKVLYYHVAFTCRTPLRCGTLDDGHELLRDYDGNLFLSGGSIAGAFRRWNNDPELLGMLGQEGSLIFSNASVVAERIDVRQTFCLRAFKGSTYRDNGSGITSSQQDTAILPVGTRGYFTLVWRGSLDFKAISPRIEAYLAALDQGYIRLGTKHSHDFGRVRLSVSRGCYDMFLPFHREAWLSGQWEGVPITLPRVSSPTVVFRVSLSMPQVYIRDSESAGHRTENGQLIIPASSIKGTLRRWSAQLSPVFQKPLLESQLFGSILSAGALVVSDGFYSDAQVVPLPPRALIDRLSHSVLVSHHERISPVRGVVQFRLSIDPVYADGIGLLLFVLRDLGLGLYELGALSAIGWGYADGITVELTSPEGSGILSVSDGKIHIEDRDGILAHYTGILGGDSYGL